MYGWTGNILKIDLGSGTIETIRPAIETYHKFIGGKGLAGYFLRPYIKQAYDSPGMPLLFFTGPLVNTPSPTSGRMVIMSRSPLTGTVGDSSVGGRFGTELKKAGWDGIIVTGISEKPCGINIIDDKTKITDATAFAGMDTDRLTGMLGKKGSIAVIGSAAENGVLFSNIAVDGHFFAGRGGLGLVMAVKKIKYIQVTGTGKTKIFDMDELLKAREQIFRLVSASPVLKGELGISEYGTGALYDLINSRRMMPCDNFRTTYFQAGDQMNAWHYKQKYNPQKTGCAGCNILCKKKAKDGTVIPEFETMSHFSALLDNRDIETVVEANRLCNLLGMDTISAAATLACHAEIRGNIIQKYEMLSLLKDIAYSRNEGNWLKLGALRYAQLKGQPGAAITVKGLELPAYDPRGAYGMALAYSTSTRGGCHLRAYPVSHEILRKPVVTDRFSFCGKARIIKLSEDLNAVVDSLTACKFVFFAASLEEFAKAYYGVTGIKTSAQDMLKAGERIYYQEKIMNSLNGFSSAHDDLPRRFFNQPGSSGQGVTVNPLNRKNFLMARSNYYKIRGLDENGMPAAEKCKELNIEWTD